MGLLDKFRKKEDGKEPRQGVEVRGKYDEACALCSEPGTEKKWMGQYWHKRCLRKSKRFAKGLI